MPAPAPTTKQLTEMVKPFPKRFMGKDDRGNDAVDHTVVTQRLLQIVGPYDLEVKEVLRSEVQPITVNKGKSNERTLQGGMFVTGAVVRLTVTLDGKQVSIEEVGGCENAAMKDGDGERMKHAMSDAIKRCAMRLGLGLHMWAQENFFLYEELTKSPAEARPPQPSKQTGAEVSAESVVESGRSSPAEPSEGEVATEPVRGSAGEGSHGAGNGETPSAPPSSSSLDLIQQAIKDKRVPSNKVLIVANKHALKLNAVPGHGISVSRLKELDPLVLDETAAELGLTQEALI